MLITCSAKRKAQAKTRRSPRFRPPRPEARHGQKIKTGECRQRANPNPQRHAARSKERQQQRHQDNGKAGDEGGFGWRGQGEAGRLERVASKHAAADQDSGAKSAAADTPQFTAIDQNQNEGRQKKAQRQEYEDGSAAQCILDQNEGRAPDQSTEDKREIGLELARHTA